MKNNVDDFIALIIKYCPSLRYQDYEGYIDAYNLLYSKGLLDSNYVEQCVNRDRFVDRISELLIGYKISAFFSDGITSYDEGPDLRIEFSGKKYNIEIITPSNIIEKESKPVQVFTFDIKGLSSKSTSSSFFINDNNFQLKVGSAVFTKAKAFNKYLANNVIQSNDINIICVNVGFFTDIYDVNLISLKHLFYNYEVINLDSEYNIGGINAQITGGPKLLEKNDIEGNDTSFLASIFENGPDSEIYSNINAVLIYNENDIYSLGRIIPHGLLFRNNNAESLPAEFLCALKVKTIQEFDPESHFINNIKKTGVIKLN
ncbi:hypothetical protein [Atlantibacter hermannii]|uniref:hypothetical protein n=1 Tax=Atlantibacter hermannii TaxID=565 RepID=UPI0013EF4A9C|nr:hypothetical protein [Atlantibacter hermannii]